MKVAGRCWVIRIGASKLRGNARNSWPSAWMPPVDAPIASRSTLPNGFDGSGSTSIASLRSDISTSRVSRSIRVRENCPARLPATGFTIVSAAPSASAWMLAAWPSCADEETTMIRACPPASIRSGSAVSPSMPGMSISSSITSTLLFASQDSAVAASGNVAATSNRPDSPTIRSITARATELSSTINTRGRRGAGTGSLGFRASADIAPYAIPTI